ncbi:ATP-binding protein [Lutimonas sp.]|uniref:Dph6-related ATP pyrophosphatase n=1 Tax=Lutimonas sp. TaxID=1872403 RepID=UPI003D9BBA9C
MEKLKTYFNWSSGKDAALALYHLKKNHAYQIDGLLTTINGYHNRVSMHGLRRELLERQVQELELPLRIIELPEEPSMEVYNQAMEQTVKLLNVEGYSHAAFGDIFLEDLRAYREEQLKKYDISCCFPLWKRNTKELIAEFLSLGFKAVVICVKDEFLDASFAGRELDADFVKDLPSTVDPCGEYGEFHTFCYDGPIFNNPVDFSIGEKVFRSYKNPDKEADIKATEMGFWFCDLIPK